jgi:hypothetical protein
MDEFPLPIVEGLPVVDVLGARIGRVARADAAELDVALSPRAARRLGVRELRVPAYDVIDVDDHEVTLREEAELLAHPERAPASLSDLGSRRDA